MPRQAALPPLGLTVAAALLAGTALVQWLPRLLPTWLSVALLLWGLGWFRFADARRCCAALLIGVAWTCLLASLQMQARLPAATTLDVQVEGRVLGLPEREDDFLRFDFQVEGGDRTAPLGHRVRLAWYGPAPRQLAPGSRWRLKLRLKPLRGSINPGTRDVERQALVQGVVAKGYVREPRSAQALAPGRGVDALRERLSGRIAAALPEQRGRFVRALALGDTRSLTDGDWEVLRATGLTHQIAISGFHVGLVAGFGALLASALYRLLPGLGRRWPRPQGAALAALVFAALYAALAGFALPTLRTLLMIAAVVAARLLRRPASASDSFALALWVLLLLDPLSVLSPGFWLSFAGVGWLLCCLPTAGAGWAMPFLRAQGVVLVGLLPLSAWFFGQVALPGPVANLLGVPVISLVVVPLCLIGLLASALSDPLSGLCWQGAAAVMDWLWQGLQLVAAWPSATLWLQEPSLMAVGLACLGAFWCLLPRVVPDRALAGLLFLPLLCPQAERPAPGQVDVQVLDVGQGMSVLVSTARHDLLFDVGSGEGRAADAPRSPAVAPLRALGRRGLDLVLVSHGARDHAGGLEAVLRAWPGTRVLGPEGWARPGMGLCEAGQHWRWDGVDFRILHPPPLFPYLGKDSSCVLRVEAGGRVALLPGDIGQAVERRLLARDATALKSDLVLVPRHGGGGISDPGFVRAVGARWAVFSLGHGNRGGLPRAEVVQAWQDAGADTIDTAQHGLLVFRLGPQGSQWRAARRRDRPRYWREPPGAGSGYAIGNAP